MITDTRRLVNSSIGVGLAAFLARTAPPRLGIFITRTIADWISSRNGWSMVKAVRANQWVVSAEKLTGKELDSQVRKTFRNTAISIYDLHRDIKKGEMIRQLAEQEDLLVEIIKRPRFAERGLLIVGPHMSNFDFIVQAGVLLGGKGLVLTIPNLTGGYKQQYDMRLQTGMEILPASVTSIRKSIEYLKRGGLVLTGMDRPMENPTYHPRFFGRPSDVPVLHVYLALKAHVPVIVASVLRKEDGSYQILRTEPIEMENDRDREQEIVMNAERVCQAAEEFIRKAPEQWTMSFPVWPEALNELKC